MKRLILGLALWFVGGLAPALAHDIGISPAELIETVTNDDSAYVLRVMTGPSMTARFPAPGLPDHCEFAGNPRGVQGTGWKSFEFGCSGGLTPDDELELAWLRDGIMLTATWADGSEAQRLFKSGAGAITVPLGELQIGSGSWLAAAKRYTGLGIEHILLGFDHLMFVLALLLIVNGPWALVETITAFTIAHSITLGLATLGFIHVPSRPVEAAIALSIMFLCVEILHANQNRIGMTYRYPWLVAFAFGLLHGLGFAGALSEIGLPESEIPLALLFFNVGVEIGQLMFVAVVVAIIWSVRGLRQGKKTWARVIPAYLIGTMATYWFLQRAAAIFTIA